MRPPFNRALLFVFVTGWGTGLLGQTDPTAPRTASVQAPAPAPVQATPFTPPGQAAPLPPGSQLARNADGTYTIRQSSRIVVLDVVVTDAKGNLVTDLKRGDFHVTEAKETQAILNFEPAGSHVLLPG